MEPQTNSLKMIFTLSLLLSHSPRKAWSGRGALSLCEDLHSQIRAWICTDLPQVALLSLSCPRFKLSLLTNPHLNVCAVIFVVMA